ncbi:SIS domain-containing protein [Bombilactobacillus bombi]|uniref:SIS domain-containing protein n=1 Tax=Bombilactobacillus bombi TaxID=1303590 RepID=UPI0015E62A8C|nr:SIS domain-containing protein [Bombilactobacillus bombi]MBA1433857.1 SIS domain-containing protein [Bombilactobacillus bombi]
MLTTLEKYINQEPDLLSNVYKNRKELSRPIVEFFRNNTIKEIYILGSGTSHHASILAKFYLEKYLQVEVDVVIPTIFTNYININNNQKYDKSEIMCIAISQTGTSRSTIMSLAEAQEKGYKTLVLTQNNDSEIVKYADVVCDLHCGSEDVMVETKGYIVTIFTIYLWALELSLSCNNLSLRDYECKCSEIRNMLLNYSKIISESRKWCISHISDFLRMKRGVITGYGLNYSTALEAGMKLGESYRCPIQSYEMEEFMHGPDMALNSEFYIFLIVSEEKELPRMKKFIEFYKKITNNVFVISSVYESDIKKDLMISTPVNIDLTPLIYIVPFQLMASILADAKDIDLINYPFNKDFSHSINS